MKTPANKMSPLQKPAISGQGMGISLIVGLASFALYSFYAAKTVQGLDCGEFITVAATGGVAHPPGYPLFTFLCRVFCAAIPVSTMAFRASLVSSLMAAGTLSLLSIATAITTKRIFDGVFVSLLLGTSSLFWRYATVCDVFAMHAFAVAASIAAASYIIVNQRFTQRGFLLLGLTLALGIAHHHTIIFVLPIHILAVMSLLWSSKQWNRKFRLLAIFASASLLGFLAYGLLLIPGGKWHWGNVATVSQLFRHFLRSDYGTFRLAPGNARLFAFDNIAALCVAVNKQFGYAVAIPCLAGCAVFAFQKRNSKRLIGALVLCFVLGGPLFLSMCNVSPQSAGSFVLERFYILPMVILALLVGIGAGTFIELLKSVPLKIVIKTSIVAVFLCGYVAMPFTAHSTYLEDYVENCLSHVKPQAILIGSSDSELGGFLYVQSVLNKRPDVVFVAPPMLGFAWYRSMLTQRNGGLVLPEIGTNNLGQHRLIGDICRANGNRPLYLSPWYWNDSSLMHSLGPVVSSGGVLLRLVGDTSVGLDIIEDQHGAALRNLRVTTIPQSQAQAQEDPDYDIYLNYARTSRCMAGLFAEKGNREKQNQWLAFANLQASPWSKPKAYK
jgi:hypothetical protein